MRILKVIHGYPPIYNAGSEVYSKNLCVELSKYHEVHVFTREENPYILDFSIRKAYINSNLTLHIMNKRFDKDGFRNYEIDKRFKDLLSELKPDIAHIGHLNHLSTGIVDILKSAGIPIVFTLHDFWLMCPRGQFLQRNYGNSSFFQLCDGQEDRKCAVNCYNMYFTGMGSEEEEIAYWTNWISKRMQETRGLSKKVDLFIAPSNYLRNKFIEEFDVPKNKIIYLDYGFPEYSKTLKSNKINPFTFGYIGTHIPSKGVNFLIEAFISLCKDSTIPCKLIIFGKPQGQNTAYLKSLAQGYPIEFRDEYDNEEIHEKVFRNVNCIVVPSIWGENSPLVIHEAQVFKVPVITADFGGMREYVKHKVNGLLFKHRNKVDLQSKMLFAIQNPALLRSFGESGYLFSPFGSVPALGEHVQFLTSLYKRLVKGEVYFET
jgi:glycosyltransferase involved in cell wall biosynthesis